ncbi:MAG: ATP-dependent dethiobiotin synthetase BioD [Nocardioides sp.]|nr:ATP-dependent dethiobiotin synthetase BioD [Nocardioides sp.]
MTGRVVVVTGTSTGVGKTVVTAALAAHATALGRSVAVVKPVQTGTDDGDSDAREIHHLTGVEVHEHMTLAEPLAPDTAARRAGVVVPTVAEHADRIAPLTASHDLVLVEGAGGLLVRLDTDGGTLLDLADRLAGAGLDASFLVVSAPGLGTLNHTELTVDAVQRRGHPVQGIVVGSWPAEPGLAERCNRDDLPRVTGLPVLGVVPAGAGGLDRAAFLAAAGGWLAAWPA